MQISFLYPQFLFLFFLIPLFVLVYLFSFFYNKKKALNFPNFEAMEKISGIGVLSKNFISLYLNIIIILLIILAISGTSISFNTETSSLSHVIAIDNSGSMKAIDLEPNRLEAAKSAAEYFIDSLPFGTEVAIISFAGNSEVVSQFTSSKLETKMALENIRFSQNEGTNIYDTLMTSSNLLKNKKGKTLILVSDGQINIGEVQGAIKYASDNNIIINSIAIGTSAGGKTEFNTLSKVDEDSLRALAFNTNGKFFSVSNNNDLKQSFSLVLDESQKNISLNLSVYLLLASLAVVILNWILFNFRFRVIP